jgi:hypothetical protein
MARLELPLTDWSYKLLQPALRVIQDFVGVPMARLECIDRDWVKLSWPGIANGAKSLWARFTQPVVCYPKPRLTAFPKSPRCKPVSALKIPSDPIAESCKAARVSQCQRFGLVRLRSIISSNEDLKECSLRERPTKERIRSRAIA